MEDDSGAENIKEEVVDCEFVQVGSQYVSQLCTACLCATRTTQMLHDDTLKQYYMDILIDMQVELDVHVLTLQVCWECLSLLKRMVRFRQEARHCYNILRTALHNFRHKQLDDSIVAEVSRPGRLTTCLSHCVDIQPGGHSTSGHLEQPATVKQEACDSADPSCDEDAAKATQHRNPETVAATLKPNYSTVPETSSLAGPLKKSLPPEMCTKASVVKGNLESKTKPHTYLLALTPSLTANQVPKENVAAERIGLQNPPPLTALSTGQKPVQVVVKSKTHKLEKKLSLIKNQNKCKVCSKMCSDKPDLILHMESHAGDKPFKCSECAKTFRLKRSLTAHMRTHTGERPYQCEICLKLYKHLSHLYVHIKSHSDERPFKCSECQKSFAKKADVVIHMRTHTGEKPYQCEVCPKAFSQKCSLLNHLRKHTGERPFQCEVCSKAFRISSNLFGHMKTHTGEKPFQCQVCKRMFSRKSQMLEHMGTHSTEKSFLCEVCSKEFRTKHNLRQHMTTHSATKPYQCEVCKKGYTRKVNLKDHMKIHLPGSDCVDLMRAFLTND